MALAYCLWLKKIVIVDVLALAGLYELRIFAGAEAVGVSVSFWLLIFSMFMFLSLALMKRFSELRSARGSDGKILGRGYVEQDLEIVLVLGTISGCLAILVLAFYVEDGHSHELYRSPELIWLACLLLFYWIARAWILAHRGQMHDDPIVFALTDRVSWVVIASLLIVFLAATLLP